ncbi:hypothetical protein BY996DRAFT_2926477 [Phakopsora pachyrhizi]|nr:hypothetical protein BY996DRAFT_2926477 [Phakopsora pachyrhizi]
MLHTDAFNKNNWVKMTRSDYVKNTKIDGIPSEVIEVCSPISQTWKAVFLRDLKLILPNLTLKTNPSGLFI